MSGTRYVLPSIDGLIAAAIFSMVLIVGNSILLDGDTGWHIRTGDYILNNFDVPSTDIFSHRKAGEPWIAYEWLADALFALVHRAAGLNGIVLLSATVIAGTFLLLFRFLQTYSFNILTVAATTILVALTTSLHWFARPHLFTLFLSVVWYSLLESLQKSPDAKRIYALPLVMALWVNLHPGFLFGFALMGIYGVTSVLEYFRTESEERRLWKKRLFLLLRVGLLCCFAALVNPYGYRLLTLPLEVFGSHASMTFIGEWQSPSFHRFTPFEFYLLLLMATFLAIRQKFILLELFLVLFATHISLVSQRYIPLFAILMAPVLARRIDALYTLFICFPARTWLVTLVQARTEKSVDELHTFNKKLDRYRFPLVLCMAAVAVTLNNGKIFGKKLLDFHFGGANYPIEAVEFLKRNPLPGRMLNFYSYGGYLIYTFYPDPRYRVFVDGRAIVGGEDYFTEFLKINLATHEWKATLAAHQVNWIVYPAVSWLSTLVLEGSEWKLIYADPNANIFIKNIPENQSLIDKFSSVQPVR